MIEKIIPQVEFSDLQSLKSEQVEAIKKRGAVLIKNVVDDEQAKAWKEDLKKFVKINPVEGEYNNGLELEAATLLRIRF